MAPEPSSLKIEPSLSVEFLCQEAHVHVLPHVHLIKFMLLPEYMCCASRLS